MKKIKYSLLFIATAFLASCDKDNGSLSLDDANSEIHPNFPYEETYVSVAPGTAKVLTIEGDTIAILTESSNISLPRHAPIEFEEIDNSNNNFQNTYKTWQVVAFEDSRNADFDYNDLVIHCKILQNKNNTTIEVHPIALGSAKNIELCVEYDGKEYTIAKNARKELFKKDGLGHIEGFINTDKRMSRYKFEKFTQKLTIHDATFGKSINWFIKVDDNCKLYAVSKNLPSENRPYGLIFVNINKPYNYNGTECGLDWFDYPVEGQKIEEVYPYFFDKNKTFKEIYSYKVDGLYYDAIKADENRKASDDCLYAIDKKY